MFASQPATDCSIQQEQLNQVEQLSPELVQAVKDRRKRLLDSIKANYPGKKGVALFSAHFEDYSASIEFSQENSFYYLTGSDRAASVFEMSVPEGTSRLYIPRYEKKNRTQYYGDYIEPTKENAEKLGFDELCFAGDEVWYQVGAFFNEQRYRAVLDLLFGKALSGETAFVLNPNNEEDYVGPRFFWDRLYKFFITESKKDNARRLGVTDISSLVDFIRRKKDGYEIKQIKKAVEITCKAHRGIAHSIVPGKTNLDIKNDLESFYTLLETESAYEPIIGVGVASCIFHKRSGKTKMQDGDLVLIDSAAKWNHYCADVTRTYPVSGKFSERQKEIYSIVLAIHKRIAKEAKPGSYFCNNKEPANSLNFSYLQFLKEYGYEFCHGIGHRLGLSPHDVGSYFDPLEIGDVFTIEPGVYIPKENIGVRIENMYLMTENGAICLSAELPDDIEGVEAMMAKSIRK